MIKTIPFHIFLLFLALPFASLSQSSYQADSILKKSGQTPTSRRTIISFSLSPAIPIGNFASKSVTNPNAGFATFGSGSQLYIGHDLSKRIGICAMSYFSSFPFDNSVVKLFQQVGGGGYQFDMTSNKWRVSSYMIGAYDIFSVKKSSKGDISLFDRAMLGFATTNSPDLVVNGSKGSSFIRIEQSSQSTTSFCYSFGLGVRYTTVKRLSVSYSIDLFSTKTSFKNVPIKQNVDGTITNTTTSINQTISTLPFSVSLGWIF